MSYRPALHDVSRLLRSCELLGYISLDFCVHSRDRKIPEGPNEYGTFHYVMQTARFETSRVMGLMELVVSIWSLTKHVQMLKFQGMRLLLAEPMTLLGFFKNTSNCRSNPIRQSRVRTEE